MGDKIGKPISVEHGQPRVLPKTAPRPNPLPERKPLIEKVSAVNDKMVETLKYASYQATQRNVKKIAEFLGITEQQVVAPLIDVCDFVIEFCAWLMTRKSKKDLTSSS